MKPVIGQSSKPLTDASELAQSRLNPLTISIAIGIPLCLLLGVLVSCSLTSGYPCRPVTTVPSPQDTSDAALKRYALDIDQARMENEMMLKKCQMREEKMKRIGSVLKSLIDRSSSK